MSEERPKEGYWYRQYVGECPVCGSETRWKERVYGPKPGDRSERVIRLSDTIAYDQCLEW